MKLSMLSERWNHIAHGPLRQVDLLKLYKSDHHLFVQAATSLIKKALGKEVFRYNINREDLDDAIQHAITEVLIRPKFPPESSRHLLKMLNMLTWWKLQAIWRNRKIYRRAENEYQTDRDTSGVYEDPSFEDSSELKELLAIFEKTPTAAALSPKKIMIIKLYVAGRTKSEIAKELGVSMPYISKMWHSTVGEFLNFVKDRREQATSARN